MRSIFNTAATIVLFVLAGCASTRTEMDPKAEHVENSWRAEDLGTFTINVPSWLKRREVQGAVEFTSSEMQFDFNEVYGFGYTPEQAKRAEDSFKHRLAFENATPRDFIKRVGNRYAWITVSQSEEWLNGGYPGKNAVQVFIPDLKGGYLDVFITYRDKADTRTALRIAESITCKP